MAKRRVNPGIEMIPLIDTMFLLLVFFIYASLQLTPTKQLPIELPPVMQALQPEKDFNQVVISETGYLLNGREIEVAELSSLPREKKVYIAADQNIAYKKVAEVLDILSRNEIKQIALETR